MFAEDDAGSDDEQETVGDMMSRILQRQEEAECAYERRRSLTVRGAMNARTGLTYMMRVGEVEPAEHGRGHERRRAAEGGRVGRATAAEVGVGPMPRPRALKGGCAVCGEKCTPQHVVMAECTACGGSRTGYLERLTKALEEVAKAVPKVTMGMNTPMAQWCKLRPVVRRAVEAVQRRAQGELTTEDAWEAVRQVIAGVVPMARAATEMGERERGWMEQKLVRRIVEAQAVVDGWLRQYKESTRKARAAKQAGLDEWWAEERRQRDMWRRLRRGLKRRVEEQRQRSEQQREAMRSVVVQAQTVNAETTRRGTARNGGEVAVTRAGGLHRVGTYAERGTRARGVAWEAGDVRRTVAEGDMRGRAGRNGRGGRGGRGRSGRSGGGGVHRGAAAAAGPGGSGPAAAARRPPPHPPPPLTPPNTAGSLRGAVRKARTKTSRWHPVAMEIFDAASGGKHRR